MGTAFPAGEGFPKEVSRRIPFLVSLLSFLGANGGRIRGEAAVSASFAFVPCRLAGARRGGLSAGLFGKLVVMEKMIAVLKALSANANLYVKGTAAREKIVEALEQNKKALVAQWGGTDKRATKALWKSSGIHDVVIGIVVKIIWPPEAKPEHKFNAKESKAVLALIPADPAEARAWLRGLSDLIKAERPFPKGEKK